MSQPAKGKDQPEMGGVRTWSRPDGRVKAGTIRMSREVHVRICEGLGVKLPRSTRPVTAPPVAPSRHPVQTQWDFSDQAADFADPPGDLNSPKFQKRRLGGAKNWRSAGR